MCFIRVGTKLQDSVPPGQSLDTPVPLEGGTPRAGLDIPVIHTSTLNLCQGLPFSVLEANLPTEFSSNLVNTPGVHFPKATMVTSSVITRVQWN